MNTRIFCFLRDHEHCVFESIRYVDKCLLNNLFKHFLLLLGLIESFKLLFLLFSELAIFLTILVLKNNEQLLAKVCNELLAE